MLPKCVYLLLVPGASKVIKYDIIRENGEFMKNVLIAFFIV